MIFYLYHMHEIWMNKCQLFFYFASTFFQEKNPVSFYFFKRVCLSYGFSIIQLMSSVTLVISLNLVLHKYCIIKLPFKDVTYESKITSQLTQNDSRRTIYCLLIISIVSVLLSLYSKEEGNFLSAS